MESYSSFQEILPKILSNVNGNFSICQKKVTVIIPAYNEENRILPVLNEVCTFIFNNTLSWEVVVSIDGTDRTEIITKEMKEKFPFLNYTKGTGRSGKGGAIKRVLPEIHGEFTVLMDADGSIAFEEIVRAFLLLDKSDVVIMSRYKKNNNIPFLRRFLSRGFNIIVRSVTGLNVSEAQSGYNIFRTEFFATSMQSVTVTNASYEVPLMYYIKKMGRRILETSAEYTHDENWKLNPISMAMSFGISLIAFRIRNSPPYAYVPKFLIMDVKTW